MPTNWKPLPRALSPGERALAEALRAAKDDSGLTLVTLALQTHYSRASWERWLNGKRVVTAEALTGFAAVTERDPRVLLALRNAALTDAASHRGAADRPVTADDFGGAAAADAGASGGSPAPRRPPAQLPFAADGFVGREVELAVIGAHLAPDRGGRSGPAIVAISGHGGIGKTALALRAAHGMAAMFPDGQLYTDLRGVDPNPRDPGEVLAQWLVDLGMSASAVPRELDARSAAFRTQLAGRHALIVVDNARDAAQIRPLIPGAPGCAVIATARRQLPSLLEAKHVPLGGLGETEAAELLAVTVGRARAEAEPEAAATIVERCAGMPLALRIAGARLAARPAWNLAALAGRLDERRRRLDELAVGDAAVRAAFETSYAVFAEDGERGGPGGSDGAGCPGEGAGLGQARAFRLLGMFPGADIDARAAAALLDVTAEQSRDVLESLTDNGLLEALPGDRYRMHDLLRVYAVELCERHEGPDSLSAAATRLTGWYFHTLIQVVRTSRADAGGLESRAVAPAGPPMTFADRKAALAWCDEEYDNIRAVIDWAAGEQLGPVTWLLARGAYDYLMLRGAWEDTIAVLRTGLAEARRHGDANAQGRLLFMQAPALRYAGRPAEAVEVCRESAALLRADGDRHALAHCMNCLADALLGIGEIEECLTAHHEAVALYAEAGTSWEVAVALNNMAYSCVEAGLFQQAIEPATRAVALSRGSDDRYGEASALDTLGEAYRGLGRLDEAIKCLAEAVRAYQESDDRYLGADSLDHYADALGAAGRWDEAREAWRLAAEWLTGVDDKRAGLIRDKSEGMDGMARKAAV